MFNSTPDLTNNNCIIQSPANCYRPLQQLYKTIYLSSEGNASSSKDIRCICKPAERYKTTNMTYGSFYYDDSLSTEKNLAMNYDKAAFARCYDHNKLTMASTLKEKNCGKDGSIFSNAYDPKEMQNWVQPTMQSCCPTDCCHNNSIYNTANCSKFQTSTPYSQKPMSTYTTPTSNSSNVHIRCV